MREQEQFDARNLAELLRCLGNSGIVPGLSPGQFSLRIKSKRNQKHIILNCAYEDFYLHANGYAVVKLVDQAETIRPDTSLNSGKSFIDDRKGVWLRCKSGSYRKPMLCLTTKEGWQAKLIATGKPIVRHPIY